MSGKVSRKQSSRFSLWEKLLLIGIALLVLVVGVLGVLTGLNVLARGPQPKPTSVPLATSTPTPVPVLFPSIRVSPQEATAGKLVIVTGKGWTPGDEASLHVVAPSGDQWAVAQTTVDQDGAFVAAFLLPLELESSDTSSVVVRASSAATGHEMSTLLRVLAREETPSPLPTAEPTRAPAETPIPTATPVQTRLPSPTATA
ncbi:MAG: hypothetical protein PVH80_05330, partial [Anaerolineae bacterium]